MSSADTLLTALGSTSKALVIDKSLSSSINFLIPFSQLKSQANITNVYWFSDSLNDITILSNNFTFLIRSDLSNVEVLKKRIRELRTANPSLKLELILTDDYFESFKVELDRTGILGELSTIKSWKLIIFDPSMNLYQLKLPQKEFNSLYLHKTTNIPFKLANFLNDYLMENSQLRITHILSKGLNSSKFVSIFKNLRNNSISALSILERQNFIKIEEGLYGLNSNNSGKQTDLIVLERNLDFLSVLLNQLSYSGIIDETYDIDINSIKLNDETIIFESSKDGEESIYDQINFLNFGIACDYLNSKAKDLQVQYDEVNNRNSTLTQVKDFVENLKTLEALKKQVILHTKISEEVLKQINPNGLVDSEDSEYNQILEIQQDILLQNLSYTNTITKIVDLIYQNFPVNDILRLVSITSIVNNGLREKDYNTLSNEVIETYGFKYFSLLKQFIQIGLISIRGDLTIIKNFQSLNSRFELTPQEEESQDPLNPSQPSFAYRGYVPLIARLLQNSFKKDHRASWSHLDLNSMILGKTIDEELSQAKETIGLGGLLKNDSTVIIVMIGGLTYSELSAIKFVEKELKEKQGMIKKFIILTDSIINANDLINVNL